LTQAQEMVGARLGLDFSDRRGEVVLRKLERALRSAALGDVPAVLARLGRLEPESPELMRFARHLTVGETYFFRDRACFQALEQRVLPALIASRRDAGRLQLRVWSAGCSTGEEPYSLAMLLDRLLPDTADWRLTILATDINPDSLAHAQAARYREWSFRSTPQWARERYFRRLNAHEYELVPQIRERVSFRPVNLAEGSYPAANTGTTAMDLILCRNVLMYFTDAARQATTDRLRRALVPGGWLVVAPSEASAALLAPLRSVNFPGTILFQKSPPTPPPPPDHPVSVLPSAPEVAPPLDAPSIAPARFPGSEPGPAVPSRVAPASSEGVPSLVQRARELANRGEVQQARTLCETAIRQDPLAVAPLLLLATVSEGCGDLDATQKALRRALYLDPDCALAQFILGVLHFRQGRKDRGRRCLGSAMLLLETLPRSTLLEHGDGITAGDLLGRAMHWLEACPGRDGGRPRDRSGS
jgi:chemotaxis protein methyltransferase CheR